MTIYEYTADERDEAGQVEREEEMTYPRVSTILAPYSDFSMVSPDTLAAASERGSLVHAACAAYALDLFASVPEELSGYFRSFKAWYDLYVYEVLAVEEEVVNKAWGYIGHVDLIANVTGFAPGMPAIVVVDYKTPVTASQTWKCQLSAYVEAAREKYGATIGGALQLKKDGSLPKMEWITDQNQAFAAFTGALSAHNYIKRKG